jgi:hypothetical protein
MNGLTSFFARYVLAGTLFGFGSTQAKTHGRSLKLPSDHPCLAFRINSSSMKWSTVQCFGCPFDRSYTFSSAIFSLSESLLTPWHYQPIATLLCDATTSSGYHVIKFVITIVTIDGPLIDTICRCFTATPNEGYPWGGITEIRNSKVQGTQGLDRFGLSRA